MKLPDLKNAKIVTLFERRANGRLIVSRKKLYYFDSMTVPVLSDGKSWYCLKMSDKEREPYFMEVRKSLKPIPKNTLH